MTLIKINFTDGGASQSVPLDVAVKLAEVRIKLSDIGIMKEEDLFLNAGAELAKVFEADVELSVVLVDNSITIGRGEAGSLPFNDDADVDWRNLNNTQRSSLLNICQVARGITLQSAEKLTTSARDLFSWTSLPAHTAPRVITSESSSISFSRVMQEVNLMTSERLSLNLDTPFVTAESEYKRLRESTTKTENITSYMLQKYVIFKENLTFSPGQLSPSMDFALAINGVIVKKGESDKDKFCNLLHALNKWGFHVPIEFALGGALYSVESTQVSEFSQATKEAEEFSVSVKAKYGGFGGGTGGSTSSQSQNNTGTSKRYENAIINQIGGKPDITRNKEILATSLGNALRWRIVNVEEFSPSLMLLNGYKHSALEPQLLLRCIELLHKYVQFGEVTMKIQPFINIGSYLAKIQSLISPW